MAIEIVDFPIKNGDPPTPADARGSALGNNTFESCFGLQN